MPVYNEERTVEEIVRRVLAEPHEKEIIAVDDGSKDATAEILTRLAAADPRVRFFQMERNQGKGAAVRRGLAEVTGDVVLIQDADLEYDPSDYGALLAPIEAGQAEVVYGSRFIGARHTFASCHGLGNRFLTLMANLLYRAGLTDVETCYKVIRADRLEGIHLKGNRWEFDPELTAKLLKRGARVHEVPIHYYGREFGEGKKIHWYDGFRVLWTLIKYRFVN